MSAEQEWNGMTLEQAFLDELERDVDSAIRMMNAFPEAMRARYRIIYIKWKNKQE